MKELTTTDLRSSDRKATIAVRPAAVLRERRLQLAYDPDSGAYRLAMS